jgi:hypothetical protein
MNQVKILSIIGEISFPVNPQNFKIFALFPQLFLKLSALLRL